VRDRPSTIERRWLACVYHERLSVAIGAETSVARSKPTIDFDAPVGEPNTGTSGLAWPSNLSTNGTGRFNVSSTSGGEGGFQSWLRKYTALVSTSEPANWSDFAPVLQHTLGATVWTCGAMYHVLLLRRTLLDGVTMLLSQTVGRWSTPSSGWACVRPRFAILV
jgi:hypothetical protein